MTRMHSLPEAQQIAEALKLGYVLPRVIAGTLCGLHPMFATVGLFVGIDEHGYERRYCFAEYADAVQSLLDYTDPHAHAPGPWIKVKGTHKGRVVDDLNITWSQTWDTTITVAPATAPNAVLPPATCSTGTASSATQPNTSTQS